MSEVSATIRLRPTRIGFLVRPTDMASVRQIMRVCCSLWGGVYNPIIPVFKIAPKEWKPDSWKRTRGLTVARGYVRFFEPDLFVEAEKGLLEETGLGSFREKLSVYPLVVTLEEFLASRDHKDWAEPAYGLSILDVLHHRYDTEQRFQLRDKRPAFLLKPERGNGLVEAIFGAYPSQKDAAYIEKAYKDVFHPKVVKASPKSWLDVFKRHAEVPLMVTGHRLDKERYWHHDLLVYVFDPARPTDLIDLWNLRLEPRPVLPVPVAWIAELADEIRSLLKAEYRPIRGNPSGVMHNPTVEVARSLGEATVKSLVETLGPGLPAGALCIKPWRNRIWEKHNDEDFVLRDQRLEVTAEERHITLPVKGEENTRASFEALYPEFASRFGGCDNRWVNAAKVTAYGPEKIATVLPFNTFDRRQPRLGLGGEWVTVGSEGWVYGQRFKNSTQSVTLLSKEQAIIGSLATLGVEAKLSDEGHIAKQVLDHLGGLWGVYLLADRDTLQLLNKMAGGLRQRSNETETTEETFEGRTASLQDWKTLLERRKKHGLFARAELADFTTRNILRLGLQTDCPQCQKANWYSLGDTDYTLICERCLNRYDFPQAALRDKNKNWRYRIIGPFSVPDYARGAYSALLALRVLQQFEGTHDHMTFSTAQELSFDGLKREADFVAWWRKETHERHRAPQLIIGEAKSLGKGDLLKPKDMAKLRDIAEKLPGAACVVATMRETFTDAEKILLRQFALWGRRPDEYGQPRNPLILLTGHELFMDFSIETTWKALGEPHSKFCNHHNLLNLNTLSDATQAIHLGLPFFGEQMRKRWERRAAQKKSRGEVPVSAGEVAA